ncbi:SPOC domain-like protein [Auriscalpium vulgare]|uniref:SPOC domain-like protein n=1 Tax=Auriscalpium vulgare TaxID=40419 RepID=A0ACB8R711_9AGAM|nr:SPOC domain-like protein [Auriscalpium vulgare]
MGATRTVELPDGPDGDMRSVDMTHLEWALQFVMLKIQEMARFCPQCSIFNGRKTDQCGVILFGTDDTDNTINDKDGGYEHVSEFIPIGQPNAGTLAKLASLQPSETIGDPIDALIVGIETQDKYLGSKKSWTRKMVLLTDGENPMEIEDWEATVKKMAGLDVQLAIIGVDFDDEEFGFEEEDKSDIKRVNEEFYQQLTSALEGSVLGTLAFALQEVTKPDVKQTRSTLMGNVLRLGDPDNHPFEALNIVVKTSKCTALGRPKSWKRFAKRELSTEEKDAMIVDEEEEKKAVWAQLKMRTEYYVKHGKEEEEEDNKDDVDKMNVDDDDKKEGEKVEKEQLVRGFKYGSSYAPCPEGSFPRLSTFQGIEICGFFDADGFRREHAMGEVQYVWADPGKPQEQVALSSLVRAMDKLNMYAITRWVTKNGSDPKMGVLAPCRFEKVDCFLWVQMPFADDVRKYTFPPLEHLVNKKSEHVTKHPYIPTDEQLEAMENFVDAMDLMDAGDKDEEGNRGAWFDSRLAYNPAIHRVKQALFHSAVVQNLSTNPVPPPHPELTKYFNPPKRVLKRAREAIEECKSAFNVKEVPKKVARARKDGHVHAHDEDDEPLLLDRVGPPSKSQAHASSSQRKPASPSSSRVKQTHPSKNDNNSETEPESDEEGALLLDRKADTGKDAHPNNVPLTPSPEPDIDPGRAPGRIVGTTDPLGDFKKNVARGDVVSKAVEDLGWAVKEVVLRPFTSRRYEEMLKCLRTLRQTCLEEDEIDAWNSFLQELKDACLDDPGNSAFWKQVQSEGRGMGLIAKTEAKEHGGKSAITDAAAAKFLDL